MVVFVSPPRGDSSPKQPAKQSNNNETLLGLLNSNGFDLKHELDAFANAVNEIDTAKVKDGLERTAMDWQAFANSLNLAVEEKRIYEYYGNLIASYCNKTGKCLRELTINEVLNMEFLHGPELVKRSLQAAAISNVAPQWIVTNPDSLEKLQAMYPADYFVFAASKVFVGIGNWGALKGSEENKLKRVKLLAKLRTLAGSQLPEKLAEANEAMRRFLALIAPSQAHGIIDWGDLVFENLTPQDVIDAIAKNIKLILKHEYRNGRLRRNVSFHDVIELKEIYNGFANFRRQGKPKKLTDTEIAYLSLKHEFMPGLTKSQVFVKTISGQNNKVEKPSKFTGKVFTGTKFKGFGK